MNRILIGRISETELLKALKYIKNDTFPVTDGITKDFYEFFLDGTKISIKKSFISDELSTSQKQALTKFIHKKDRTKRLVKL